jgi:hypothetical protein
LRQSENERDKSRTAVIAKHFDKETGRAAYLACPNSVVDDVKD